MERDRSTHRNFWITLSVESLILVDSWLMDDTMSVSYDWKNKTSVNATETHGVRTADEIRIFENNRGKTMGGETD